MTTGEDTHGCDYFTSIFLLPQLCNSTVLSLLARVKTGVFSPEHWGGAGHAPPGLPRYRRG
ncbi:hypothetical protein CEY17_15085 [Corynebacterium glutamicum ATCC 14067]|nr:hypothetical protein CEY17_15085 [Corynebacterium glutamicum ATCC 14067]